MKEHQQATCISQQAHDRRRRKFVREREAEALDLLKSSAENEIVEQLHVPCKAENLEAEKRQNVLIFKNIVKENRINRHYLIDSMLHKDEQYWSEWQQVKVTRELDWVVGPRLQSQLERIDFLEEAQFSANRQCFVLIVSKVVDRIISLTEWVTSIRALGLLSDRILLTTPTV